MDRLRSVAELPNGRYLDNHRSLRNNPLTVSSWPRAVRCGCHTSTATFLEHFRRRASKVRISTRWPEPVTTRDQLPGLQASESSWAGHHVLADTRARERSLRVAVERFVSVSCRPRAHRPRLGIRSVR